MLYHAHTEQELLGIVDHLVVACGKKVLLVCNEEEWLKRQGDVEGYRALVEKTVWRKCRFEHPIDIAVERVLGDELCAIYPEALEDVVSAMRGIGVSNYRSLCKLRPLLVGMRKSGFFSETPDKESAREVFREFFYFAVTAAMGKRLDPQSGSGGFIADELKFESSRAKYESLDFIPRYFERCEGVDSDHVLFCLEDYLATYYPDGPAARKALACIERIKRILFRDEEVPELIRAIVDGVSPSDGSRGLSFNVYPDVLRTVSAIAEEFGSALSDGITLLVDAMKCAVERDPEAAVKSVRNNRVEWQEVPFDPSGVFELPKIKEVDELRDHALKTLVRRRSESLNDVMKNASVQLVDNLYKALDEFGDSREAVSLLASLDASWFAVAMAKMPPEKIRAIHELFAESGHVGMLSYSLGSDQDRAELSVWALSLKSEIEKLDRPEYYQKRYFEIILYNLDKIGSFAPSTLA